MKKIECSLEKNPVFCLPGEHLPEWADIFLAFALDGMQDSFVLQVGGNGHVFMAFPQAGLIDSDVPHLSRRDGSVKGGIFNGRFNWLNFMLNPACRLP